MGPDTTPLRALCLGGLDWDELLVLPHYPEQGELVHALLRTSGVGGVGRCALALAGIGYSVSIAAQQGSGRGGELARDELESAGITCTTRTTEDEHVSTILVSGGERTILTSPKTGPYALPPVTPTGVDLILCATSAPEVFVETAREAPKGCFLSYDGGDRSEPKKHKAAEIAHIVTGRPRFFAGTSGNYENGMAELLRKGVKVVAATNGGQPVHVRTPTDEYFVEVPQTTPVDTTGCGDVFHAVLAGRIASGWETHEAVVDAVARASAHGSVLGNSELHRRITRHGYPDRVE